MVDGIYDDHVPAHNLGIPAIDIIDTRFGEGASYLSGHWHTHNDTIDKVSAESLETVGYILEYGLKTNAWTNVRTTTSPDLDSDMDGIPDEVDECPLEFGSESNGCEEKNDDSVLGSQDFDDLTTGIILALCTTVCANLLWIIFADNKGRGEIRARHRVFQREVQLSAKTKKIGLQHCAKESVQNFSIHG